MQAAIHPTRPPPSRPPKRSISPPLTRPASAPAPPASPLPRSPPARRPRRAPAAQRAFAADPAGAVLDGRDIGTVICPDADVKLFVTADLAARTQRRLNELRARGEQISFEELQAQIAERDRRDTSRADAPLRQARGRALAGYDPLSIEGAVEAACRLIDAARMRPRDLRVLRGVSHMPCLSQAKSDGPMVGPRPPEPTGRPVLNVGVEITYGV